MHPIMQPTIMLCIIIITVCQVNNSINIEKMAKNKTHIERIKNEQK